MKLFEIGIAIYFALGLLGYISIAGTGDRVGSKKTPSFWGKVLVIVFWPLAMVGAIDY
jgi:hypothetical protein